MVNLPVELIDMIIGFTDDFYMIKYFKKYLSNYTIKKLLKNKNIYKLALNRDIKGISIIKDYQNFNHEKLIINSIKSKNLETFKYCYLNFLDENNKIINYILKNDLYLFLKYLYENYFIKFNHKTIDYCIRYNSYKTITFLININCCYNIPGTELCKATSYGHFNIVKIYSKKDLKYINKAIHIAKIKRYKKIYNYLENLKIENKEENNRII